EGQVKKWSVYVTGAQSRPLDDLVSSFEGASARFERALDAVVHTSGSDRLLEASKSARDAIDRLYKCVEESSVFASFRLEAKIEKLRRETEGSPALIAEIGRLRRDFGLSPLEAPPSQFYNDVDDKLARLRKEVGETAGLDEHIRGSFRKAENR